MTGENVREELSNINHMILHQCRICKLIINADQVLPLEYPINSLCVQFRNYESWLEYNNSGLCQSCQDNRDGIQD